MCVLVVAKEKQMRMSFYEFPEDTPEGVLIDEELPVVLKNGQTISSQWLTEEKRSLIDHFERVTQCTITYAKKMLKKYGGRAWTEHYDRDGGLFEVTPIELTGNNSRFKYNRHL